MSNVSVLDAITGFLSNHETTQRLFLSSHIAAQVHSTMEACKKTKNL